MIKFQNDNKSECIESEDLFLELTLKDGSIYKGDWQDGYKMHGKGRWTFPDGRYYDGEWVKGVRCGYGIFVWPDGENYEGEWRDNVRHGRGKHTSASGRVWDGMWADDEWICDVIQITDEDLE